MWSFDQLRKQADEATGGLYSRGSKFWRSHGKLAWTTMFAPIDIAASQNKIAAILGNVADIATFLMFRKSIKSPWALTGISLGSYAAGRGLGYLVTGQTPTGEEGKGLKAKVAEIALEKKQGGYDDPYNTIEGLPEYGMAGAVRSQNTDFGSGYQGNNTSKKTNDKAWSIAGGIAGIGFLASWWGLGTIGGQAIMHYAGVKAPYHASSTRKVNLSRKRKTAYQRFSERLRLLNPERSYYHGVPLEHVGEVLKSGQLQMPIHTYFGGPTKESEKVRQRIIDLASDPKLPSRKDIPSAWLHSRGKPLSAESSMVFLGTTPYTGMHYGRGATVARKPSLKALIESMTSGLHGGAILELHKDVEKLPGFMLHTTYGASGIEYNVASNIDLYKYLKSIKLEGASKESAYLIEKAIGNWGYEGIKIEKLSKSSMSIIEASPKLASFALGSLAAFGVSVGVAKLIQNSFSGRDDAYNPIKGHDAGHWGREVTFASGDFEPGSSFRGLWKGISETIASGVKEVKTAFMEGYARSQAKYAGGKITRSTIHISAKNIGFSVKDIDRFANLAKTASDKEYIRELEKFASAKLGGKRVSIRYEPEYEGGQAVLPGSHSSALGGQFEIAGYKKQAKRLGQNISRGEEIQITVGGYKGLGNMLELRDDLTSIFLGQDIQNLSKKTGKLFERVLMFHETGEALNAYALTGSTLGQKYLAKEMIPTLKKGIFRPGHYMTLVQEERFLRTLGDKDLYEIHRVLRGKADVLSHETRFSGYDDAYNTIEGLRHGGIASELRQILTEFGSGWRGIFRRMGNFFKGIFSRPVLDLAKTESIVGRALSIEKSVKGDVAGFARGMETEMNVELMRQASKDFPQQYFNIASGRTMAMDVAGETLVQPMVAHPEKLGNLVGLKGQIYKGSIVHEGLEGAFAGASKGFHGHFAPEVISGHGMFLGATGVTWRDVKGIYKGRAFAEMKVMKQGWKRGRNMMLKANKAFNPNKAHTSGKWGREVSSAKSDFEPGQSVKAAEKMFSMLVAKKAATGIKTAEELGYLMGKVEPMVQAGKSVARSSSIKELDKFLQDIKVELAENTAAWGKSFRPGFGRTITSTGEPVAMVPSSQALQAKGFKLDQTVDRIRQMGAAVHETGEAYIASTRGVNSLYAKMFGHAGPEATLAQGWFLQGIGVKSSQLSKFVAKQDLDLVTQGYRARQNVTSTMKELRQQVDEANKIRQEAKLRKKAMETRKEQQRLQQAATQANFIADKQKVGCKGVVRPERKRPY